MDFIMPKIVALGIYNSTALGKSSGNFSKNRKNAMFELELPIESKGISYIDKEEREITQGLFIVAKPGQVRHTRFPYKCYYVHMTLSEGELYDRLIALPSFIEIREKEKYKKLFSELCRLGEISNENDSIKMYSLLLHIIHLAQRDAKESMEKFEGKKSHRETLDRVFKHIEENIQTDLDLASVSAVAHLSPTHFHNVFKTCTGKTLREYIEDKRIEKAKQLILGTDYTLTRISQECGFSSQAYFNYVFKKRTNKTPREYERAICQKYKG